MRKYKLSDIRRSLWKQNRPMMESFRQRATEQAKKIKQNKNENLKNFVVSLPEIMSTVELKEKLQDLNYGSKTKKYKIDSLVKRMSHKRMIKFDYNMGFWINQL